MIMCIHLILVLGLYALSVDYQIKVSPAAWFMNPLTTTCLPIRVTFLVRHRDIAPAKAVNYALVTVTVFRKKVSGAHISSWRSMWRHFSMAMCTWA